MFVGLFCVLHFILFKCLSILGKVKCEVCFCFTWINIMWLRDYVFKATPPLISLGSSIIMTTNSFQELVVTFATYIGEIF